MGKPNRKPMSRHRLGEKHACVSQVTDGTSVVCPEMSREGTARTWNRNTILERNTTNLSKKRYAID